MTRFELISSPVMRKSNDFTTMNIVRTSGGGTGSASNQPNTTLGGLIGYQKENMSASSPNNINFIQGGGNIPDSSLSNSYNGITLNN